MTVEISRHHVMVPVAFFDRLCEAYYGSKSDTPEDLDTYSPDEEPEEDLEIPVAYTQGPRLTPIGIKRSREESDGSDQGESSGPN